MWWEYASQAALSTGQVFLLVIGFSIIIGLIFGAVFKMRDATKKFWSCVGEVFFISLVFGGLAIVTGFLTAASRVSAVSEVIPAVLALIGGLSLYLIDKGIEKFFITGIAVLSFSTMFFLGSAYGSYQRQSGERQITSIGVLKHQANVEFAINKYRAMLKLPPINPIINDKPE